MAFDHSIKRYGEFTYSMIDGAHMFTGRAGPYRGICAGHVDLDVALEEFALQLKYFLDKNQVLE